MHLCDHRQDFALNSAHGDFVKIRATATSLQRSYAELLNQGAILKNTQPRRSWLRKALEFSQ